MNDLLHIGIVGAGGFAHFAAQAFLQAEVVNIVAVCDIDETAAKELSDKLNAKAYTDFDVLLQDENINLIYIATPPFLHYEQSKKALLAGKHVICEKPAALHADEAEELAAVAKAADLLYVVNLMQRYNFLYDVVKKTIDEQLAGNFLHGFFENYASDESLHEQHWFWDTEKSGGIFIEHGVHFFDMFSGWLGDGELINSITLQSNFNKEITDRAQATVLYKNAFVNFYHCFNQPDILDRQELRLQFDYADITLYEWIPVKLKLHGVFTNKQLERLLDIIPDASVVHQNNNESYFKKITGRFSTEIFYEQITIEAGNSSDKQNRYRQMLTAMITDQFNWIKDHNHVRKIDETNAVESVRIAEAATQSAKNYSIF